MARYAAVGRCLRHLALGACRPASPLSEYFVRTDPCSLPLSSIEISPPTATGQPARIAPTVRPTSLQGERESVRSFARPPDLGVLVCEAFRERSEQRTNKYPEGGGCVPLSRRRRPTCSYFFAVESPPEVSEWARQSLLLIESQRKVRAPSDRAPGNAWGA